MNNRKITILLILLKNIKSRYFLNIIEVKVQMFPKSIQLLLVEEEIVKIIYKLLNCHYSITIYL